MMGRPRLYEREEEVTGALASLARVEGKAMDWLWPGRIAFDSLTLLTGEPDVGKSMVALDLAARVSRGGAWPDGQPNGVPGGVLLISVEDHLECTVRPILTAAGADMDQIRSLSEVCVQSSSTTYRRPVDLKRDMYILAEMVEATPDCRLVVIDPITSFLGRGTNPRGILISLMKMLTQIRVAVLGVTHLTAAGKQALHRNVGGIALTTAARAMWMVTRDPENMDRRMLLPVKNNLARENRGLAFELIKKEGESAPHVEWSSTAVETTADAALRQLHGRSGPDPHECKLAEEFLRQTLAGEGLPVKEVEAEGLQAHGFRLDTLRRARKNLKVKAFRKKIPGPWWIRLRADDEKNKITLNKKELPDLQCLGEIPEDLQELQDEEVRALEEVGAEVGSGKSEVGSWNGEVGSGNEN
jgi:putative DNA primase/helicase